MRPRPDVTQPLPFFMALGKFLTRTPLSSRWQRPFFAPLVKPLLKVESFRFAVFKIPCGRPPPLGAAFSQRAHQSPPTNESNKKLARDFTRLLSDFLVCLSLSLSLPRARSLAHYCIYAFYYCSFGVTICIGYWCLTFDLL